MKKQVNSSLFFHLLAMLLVKNMTHFFAPACGLAAPERTTYLTPWRGHKQSRPIEYIYTPSCLSHQPIKSQTVTDGCCPLVTAQAPAQSASSKSRKLLRGASIYCTAPPRSAGQKEYMTPSTTTHRQQLASRGRRSVSSSWVG